MQPGVRPLGEGLPGPDERDTKADGGDDVEGQPHGVAVDGPYRLTPAASLPSAPTRALLVRHPLLHHPPRLPSRGPEHKAVPPREGAAHRLSVRPPRVALGRQDVVPELPQDGVLFDLLGEVDAAVGDLADELGVGGEEGWGAGGRDEGGLGEGVGVGFYVGPVWAEEAFGVSVCGGWVGGWVG